MRHYPKRKAEREGGRKGKREQGGREKGRKKKKRKLIWIINRVDADLYTENLKY